MWSLENDQRLLRLIKGAPLWIGACHMGPQSSIGAPLSVQQKREVVRQGCTILLSDQGSKAIFPHECMQHSHIIFTKGFWDIHSSPQTIHSTSSSTSPSSTKSPSFTLIAFTVPFTVDCTRICIFMDSSITTSWSTEIFSPGLTKNSKITPAMLDTTRFILARTPPFQIFFRGSITSTLTVRKHQNSSDCPEVRKRSFVALRMTPPRAVVPSFHSKLHCERPDCSSCSSVAPNA